MDERTEEQVLAQAPITVWPGGEKHDVKLLVIRESREWRGKVVGLLSSLSQYSSVDTSHADEFHTAMDALIVGMGDQVLDLFFEYAKELDRDEIEKKATDQEVSVAFKQVVAIAFPFVGNVAGIAEKLSQ